MKRKVFSIILTLSLVLSLIPIISCGAEDEVSYEWCDKNGQNWETKTCTDCTVVSYNRTTWGTSGTDSWYVVRGNVSIYSRITVTGAVNLILTDGCSLTAYCGMYVPIDSSLTIWGQSVGSGSLTARADEANHAAIGGNADEDSGAITINGSQITASGVDNIADSNSAGIGGGSSGNSTSIIINGGVITAKGRRGAGIGGGGSAGQEAGAGNGIVINGGIVTASSVTGAGIGGGRGATGGGDAGSIEINGGTVTATGGEEGAGIGAGWSGASTGSITINGGTVTATASSKSDLPAISGDNSVITIDNKYIHITSDGEEKNAYEWSGMANSVDWDWKNVKIQPVALLPGVTVDGPAVKGRSIPVSPERVFSPDWLNESDFDTAKENLLSQLGNPSVSLSVSVATDTRIESNNALYVDPDETAANLTITAEMNGQATTKEVAVTAPFAIKNQTTSSTLVQGRTATLSVELSGDYVEDAEYQWYQAAESDSDQLISGAEGNTYTVPEDLTLGEHTYYCAISDNQGDYRLQSGNAVVTVTEFVEDTGGGDNTNTPGTSSGGNSGPATYPPTVSKPDNGQASVSPRNPERGDTVTVTPKPDEGYETGGVVVKDRRGNTLEVTDNGDGTYSFTQPAGLVTIEVVFLPLSSGFDGDDKDCPSLLFADLDTGAWYHEAVDYVLRSGLMKGNGDGTFGPNDPLSRAMLTQILYNAAGGVPVNYLMRYDDVLADAWYTEAVRWATSEGIVSGYDGGYKPDGPITREQLAAMLYRYVQSLGGGFTGAWMFRLDYDDLGEISDYSYEAVAWCAMNGILGGYEDGALRPRGQATRAETASMLMRFFERDK